MVGTDYPYDLGDWNAAKKVEQLDIPDADKLLMLEGNAKRLLKIK
jgi:predicted TIM-barrel fold metal-dependent hydrolase